MKAVNKKALIGILSVFLAGLMVGMVYAQAVSQTHIISGGLYPGAPSWTIWGNGAGTYYAKNGYGASLASNGDFETLFESCLAENVTIYIADGFHYVADQIDIGYNFVTVKGLGWVHLTASAGLSGKNMFSITGNNTVLENLYMNGAHIGEKGIYANFTYNGHYSKLEVLGFLNDGIMLEAIGTFGNNWVTENQIIENHRHGLHLYMTTDDFISNNDIGANEGDNLRLVSTGGETVVDNKLYMAGWTGTTYSAVKGQHGINMDGSNFNVISNNVARANAGDGLSVDNSANCTISGNTYSYNDQLVSGSCGLDIANSKYIFVNGEHAGHLETGVAATQYDGILVRSTVNTTVIVGSYCWGNTNGDIIVDNSSTTNWVISSVNGTTLVK